MISVRRLLALFLLISIGASSVEVVFGDSVIADTSAAQSTAQSVVQVTGVGNPDLSAGDDLPNAPRQPTGETSDCACLCACVCTGANSAVVPAVFFAGFQVLESELAPTNLGRVQSIEPPRPPFRPPVA